MPSETTLTEDEQWRYFIRDVFLVAIFQGRFSYCLMSIHAVNPTILPYLFRIDPYPYLWANMIYGISVMLYTRPSLSIIAPFNRLVFGILGSLMFNHSSMICYQWLSTVYPNRPYIRGFWGFVCGRLMMVHLLAFLYHIDTRSSTSGAFIRRDFAFESMYLY